MLTRMAIVAIGLASATPAMALTCYCGVAACTMSTLIDAINAAPAACTLPVSGTTVDGTLNLRYAALGVTLTSFTLGSGVTHWNGDLIFGGQSMTVDITGLTHLNGTLGKFGSTSDALTLIAPNLERASDIKVTSSLTFTFLALVSVGIAAPGVSVVAGSELQVDSSSSTPSTFPLLTTIGGQVSCGSNKCTSASTFPALTTIEGNLGTFSGGNLFPALVNVTGDYEYPTYYNSTAWTPLLTTVGGNANLQLDPNTDPTKWPPLETVKGGLIVKAYKGFSTHNPLTTLSVPGVSVGYVYVNFYETGAASAVTELIFPNLTTITGEFTTASVTNKAEVNFWGMRDVVDLRLEALTSVNASLSLNRKVWSHDGLSATPPPADTTPLNVHVQCISAMQTWFSNWFGGDAKTACPSGCAYCTSSGGGSPQAPTATTVNTVQLQMAVAACFAEDPSGNCLCPTSSKCGVLSGPISAWDFTGNNLNMESLFQGRTTFNQPIGSWDVSGATSMKKMFRNASSFNQPIGGWDTSSVTDMTEMFAGATAFARDISGWDVDQVTTHTDMFDGADAFNAKYTCTGPKCSGDPKSKLSSGQVAGIAVGCVAFASVVVIVACLKRRRRANDKLRARLGIAPAGVASQQPQPQIIIVQQ